MILSVGIKYSICDHVCNVCVGAAKPRYGSNKDNDVGRINGKVGDLTRVRKWPKSREGHRMDCIRRKGRKIEKTLAWNRNVGKVTEPPQDFEHGRAYDVLTRLMTYEFRQNGTEMFRELSSWVWPWRTTSTCFGVRDRLPHRVCTPGRRESEQPARIQHKTVHGISVGK